MKIKIKNPVIEKVGNLKEGTAFWQKRDKALYLLMKDNCYAQAVVADAERVWPEEKGNFVAVVSLSEHLISTVTKDKEVVVASDCGIVAYPTTLDDYTHLEALETNQKFRNFYQCPDCHTKWQDEWSCICNDDCPKCGCRHIEPYKSEDI